MWSVRPARTCRSSAPRTLYTKCLSAHSCNRSRLPQAHPVSVLLRGFATQKSRDLPNDNASARKSTVSTARDEPSARPGGDVPSDLLAETGLSHKAQRKADWAIIKDMAHYLWPKDDLGTRFRVGLSIALLVSAKVRDSSFLVQHKLIVDRFSMYKCHSTSKT